MCAFSLFCRGWAGLNTITMETGMDLGIISLATIVMTLIYFLVKKDACDFFAFNRISQMHWENTQLPNGCLLLLFRLLRVATKSALMFSQ